jgi:DNA-binding MarR family transcriptional regulator
MADKTQVEELTRLLIEFYERFSSWEQAVVRDSGITLQQMHTLETLGACGGLRMKELAEKMGITTGSLTVLVDRLVRSGHVERRPIEGDRRSILVGLTGKGEALFAEHHALHAQLSQELASALEPGELPALLGMLRRLAARI